ncbi:MAG: hypothetical protein MHPSP_001604 [Paramarteilia canceri]
MSRKLTMAEWNLVRDAAMVGEISDSVKAATEKQIEIIHDNLKKLESIEKFNTENKKSISKSQHH